MKLKGKDIREAGRIVLAHGEVTGHCHEVLDAATALPPDMASAQFFEEPDGCRMLLIMEPCVLRHDEHSPIALDPAIPILVRQGDVLLLPQGPGCWEVRRQSEHTPAAIQRVLD